ncbi:Hypothetical protein Minf_1946 [Methylacidiphilum infernorum V4]|uniref:Uncharacterized protein n=1 Tax=Methylacidiphilum infernorum (isolate V4) TaxID=481448 RepID=B3DYF2_METI4|nr:Hypothetical protein Minf_1946 [Methylacidiphilum infernorum V4]
MGREHIPQEKALSMIDESPNNKKLYNPIFITAPF